MSPHRVSSFSGRGVHLVGGLGSSCGRSGKLLGSLGNFWATSGLLLFASQTHSHGEKEVRAKSPGNF